VRRPTLLNTSAVAAGLLVMLAAPRPASAWNETGHRAIGEMAKQLLQMEAPEVMSKVSSLLAIDLPEDAKLKNPSHDMQLAACWPDDLKRAHIKKYDAWHYLDIPYGLDGFTAPKLEQPAHGDVVTALTDCVHTLGNPQAATQERARSLRFVLHLVGDIHQPLHCIGGYSAQTPDGDKGGNLFEIRVKSRKKLRTTKLHSFWDEGGGIFKTHVSRSKVGDISKKTLVRAKISVADLQSQVRATPHKAWGHDDFAAWANEGHALAGQVYGGLQPGAPVPDGYAERAQDICRERACRAAVRLTAVLRDTLGQR
jgi:S1/P1 Nuclease